MRCKVVRYELQEIRREEDSVVYAVHDTPEDMHVIFDEDIYSDEPLIKEEVRSILEETLGCKSTNTTREITEQRINALLGMAESTGNLHNDGFEEDLVFSGSPLFDAYVRVEQNASKRVTVLI